MAASNKRPTSYASLKRLATWFMEQQRLGSGEYSAHVIVGL
jgi:hypothetical protein